MRSPPPMPPTRTARRATLKPLSGVPLGIKDLFCTERRPDHGRLAASWRATSRVYESTVSGNLFAAGAGMLGKLNMDEFAMGSSNETSAYGTGPLALAAKRRRQRRADPGRQLGRLGLGGRGAAGAGRDRHRHRRLDPPARRLRRHHRDQADLRPLLALGHRRLRLLARPGRADGARREGLRDPARGDGRLRCEGFDLARTCRCPTWEAALSSDIRGKRIGIPKEYRIDGVPAEIDAVWEQGIAWLRDAGAEIVEVSLPHTKYALPTYYIIAPAEASSNLARYDGVRYGLRVQPEQGALDDMYEATRAAGFGAEVKRRIMIGTYVLSAGFYDAYFNQAQKVRALIARDFERCSAGCRPAADPDRAQRRLRARRESWPIRSPCI